MALSRISSNGIANTGVTGGTYGGSTNIPVVTIDTAGRVSNIANVAVNIPAGYSTANALPTMLMLSGL